MLVVMTLDRSNPVTRRVLACRERVHAVVMASAVGRPLWRLEGGRLYVAARRVDAGQLACRMGGGVVRPVDWILDGLREGDVFRFTMDANPVVTAGGRRMPVVDPVGLVRWLVARFRARGCVPMVTGVRILPALRFRKTRGGSMVTLHHVRYEGWLIVTDPVALRAMLTGGVGRGKAYGLGLPLLSC